MSTASLFLRQAYITICVVMNTRLIPANLGTYSAFLETRKVNAKREREVGAGVRE